MCCAEGAGKPETDTASTRAKLAAQADLTAVRREFAFRARWLESRLRPALSDQRDQPVLSLLLNVALVTAPSAVLIYVLNTHLAGLLHLIFNYSLFLQRFLVALLHVTEHRRLFKPGHTLANSLSPMLLAPLYGVPSGMYKLHHKVMHHVEDNRRPHDISSTEPYQRDSLLHFLRYWARHAFAAWLEVPLYALHTQRYGLLAECLATESAYFIAAALSWRLRQTATLWVFVIPYLVTSLALMFGNWSQHMFLQPDASPSKSGYKNAYNCVASKDNQLTFNDGYHIQHHLNSQLHWSELPQQFASTLAEHGRQRALVFEGIGVFEVGMLVFMGRLHVLAKHVLPCDVAMAELSMSERVELLQSRLKPVECSCVQSI
ncbi:hypothetical protein WJX73_002930 [Symbiochloris irregularis]|uniref:Fatty acid desaturase domain-containing protein n=1 Tax=Symbiochloris irregularis TaxID=706552 RepID=A0AAW1PRC1_9CHLO